MTSPPLSVRDDLPSGGRGTTLGVRTAVIADLRPIIALLADDPNGARREDASLPLDPGYERAFLEIEGDPHQEIIVGEIDGVVVATLQISYIPGLAFRGALRGQIESVRVASDHRNRGLGAELIDWAVERCRARGCRFVQLTSQKDRAAAHRFYERLGWDRSHLGFKLHFGEER